MKPVIETVDLNSLNQLRITVSEFQGKQRLDIRHFFRTDPIGEFVATKKGINISVDSIGEFRKALDQIFSEVEMAEVGEGDEA